MLPVGDDCQGTDDEGACRDAATAALRHLRPGGQMRIVAGVRQALGRVGQDESQCLQRLA